MRLESSAEALLLIEERLQPFEAAYRRALASLAERQVPLSVCTIYNGALEPDTARLARIVLMLFNDVILRAALEYRAPVIDLRRICVEPEDYANPIEPSGIGGRKDRRGDCSGRRSRSGRAHVTGICRLTNPGVKADERDTSVDDARTGPWTPRRSRKPDSRAA